MADINKLPTTGNSYSVNELKKMTDTIHNMDTHHHIEILGILVSFKNYSIFNENNNGILINITELPNEMLYKINEYITRIKNQELFLNIDEQIKENYKKLLV